MSGIRQQFKRHLLLAALITAPLIGYADQSGRWDGVWSAEDGEFVVRIISNGERFHVFPVAPVGLGWNTREGFISGQSATVNAEFQGVTGTVLIQLTGPDTAIARPLSCQPDYHFICTLARNQQAHFQRNALGD